MVVNNIDHRVSSKHVEEVMQFSDQELKHSRSIWLLYLASVL